MGATGFKRGHTCRKGNMSQGRVFFHPDVSQHLHCALFPGFIHPRPRPSDTHQKKHRDKKKIG